MRHLGTIGLSVFVVAYSNFAASGHDGRVLGNGQLSAGPKAGYLFSCQRRFNPNAPGAQRSGEWIVGNKYYPDRKPVVGGQVRWPNARIEITVEGDTRIVSANNLPTHPTGIFPVRRNDPAYRYDRNPNRIREQNILLRLPATPKVATAPSCVPMGMIGFTRVGGALYNALDARGRDAAAQGNTTITTTRRAYRRASMPTATAC